MKTKKKPSKKWDSSPIDEHYEYSVSVAQETVEKLVSLVMADDIQGEVFLGTGGTLKGRDIALTAIVGKCLNAFGKPSLSIEMRMEGSYWGNVRQVYNELMRALEGMGYCHILDTVAPPGKGNEFGFLYLLVSMR
jgi:hypothetical protein